MSNVSLNESGRVKFLPTILKEVMADKLFLFENNELLSLNIDFIAFTETKLQLLILQALERLFTNLTVAFLLDHIRLQIGQFLQTLFSTLDHEIS